MIKEESYLKDHNLKDMLIEIVIPILLSFTIVCFWCCSMAEGAQVPKDLFFMRAALVGAVFIFLIRRIPVNRYITWASLALGLLLVFLYCELKPINVNLYGEQYFQVILLKLIIVVGGIVLIIDSITSGKLLAILKKANALFYFYLLIIIVAVMMKRRDAIPLIFPTLALMTTEIEGKKWVKIIDCFCAGYYLAFAFLFTKSLIESPNNYQDGRYIGIFLNVGTAGMIAGGAVVSCLYFIGRYNSAKKKSPVHLIVPIITIVYPLYAMIKISSRSPQVGVLLSAFCFFVFLHGKGRNTIKRRAIISGMVVLILIAGIIGYSCCLSYKYERGMIEASDLSYWQRHVMPLTNGDWHQHEFGNNFVLNALDRFSSDRLTTWKYGLQKVELGQVQSDYNPHNFFISLLLEYGAIVGGGFILFFFASACICICRVCRGDISEMLHILWLSYCLVVFNVTTTNWIMIMPNILLICQYPTMFKKNKQEDEMTNAFH